MRDRPTLRVSGLMVANQRLLLVRQRRGGEGYWLLPGGAVEFGESLSAALEREFLEELDLSVVAGRPVALVESISPDMASYVKHVVHVILEVHSAIVASPTPAPSDPAVLDSRFFALHELASVELRPPIGEFLSDYLTSGTEGMRYLGARW